MKVTVFLPWVQGGEKFWENFANGRIYIFISGGEILQEESKFLIFHLYLHHQKLKKNQYNARIIQIEKGSFTPLIFSCTGGAGPKAEGTSWLDQHQHSFLGGRNPPFKIYFPLFKISSSLMISQPPYFATICRRDISRHFVDTKGCFFQTLSLPCLCMGIH